MPRVLVVGSAGVGKTTLATVLGKAWGVPVYHLDRFGLLPGWVRRPEGELAHDVDVLMTATDDWVIEGNYNAVLAPRLDKAETLVLIDLPLHVCLLRVFARWWKNRGKVRHDLPEGCIEPLPWTFVLWVLRAPPKRQAFWVDLAAQMPHIRFVHLTSVRQVEAFKRELTYV